MGHRCSGVGGSGLHGGLQFHSGEAVIRRRGAQYQPSAFLRADGVEGVGTSAGTAGECLQILDHDAVAEQRGEHAGEFVDQPCSLLGCPKENIRCATRRIWISSAPSVIR